ncbi:MAG: ribonuclease H-like domain-containing protein [Promethearchaeota archaeon]
MDYYYNFESLDITHLEKYKGKKIEDIFPNHKIIKNQSGEFMELIWKENNIPCDLNLLITKERLFRNLKVTYYIGEITERQLFQRGMKTLNDLTINKKYRNSVNEILNLIAERNYKKLCNNRYIYDIDVSFCFELEQLLFLDIETLGLYDSPMIIIGIGFFKDRRFEIHTFFARNLEEEISMLEHLKNSILPKFRCFITYNGKSFDIPYIANRFLYFFDENPMISESISPFECVNSKFHHIDLYHNCRRIYKGMFNSYSLTNMEEKLLNWKRENELPSNMVGICYKRYLKNPKKYVGLIKEIIDHNYYDIYSMPLIYEKLLKNLKLKK